MTPVPADVYRAALRLYLRAGGEADAALVDEWGRARWPGCPACPTRPHVRAFWVLSISYQDGRREWQSTSRTPGAVPRFR
jgi:hypothetical protein